MQRYSVRTVVKYRYANGSRIFTAAFRKSEIWVFRSIPFTVYLPYRPFCHCLLRIKIISRQEAERASRKGKKFNYKQLRLCQIGAARRMPLRATQKKWRNFTGWWWDYRNGKNRPLKTASEQHGWVALWMLWVATITKSVAEVTGTALKGWAMSWNLKRKQPGDHVTKHSSWYVRNFQLWAIIINRKNQVWQDIGRTMWKVNISPINISLIYVCLYQFRLCIIIYRYWFVQANLA